jgi:hypothetical protein
MINELIIFVKDFSGRGERRRARRIFNTKDAKDRGKGTKDNFLDLCELRENLSVLGVENR